ncbi:interleukin-15 receptor subunit alpha isoform X2 [Taeniopygia guttata]|uniref:interleukin-15 receptor subunit alpha isoform X2 n=1 Tax=Taeniopygia guttata TaxID=59729 RepID=UPI003BB8BAD8
MAPPLLLQLLCGTAALLLLRSAAEPAHCSRPKAVANARIEVGNRSELNSRLRYSCNPGYKRKAGTSNLIQCILWNGSEPRWTDPTLQCIRDPSLSWETPGMESTTQRGTTGASLNSSPSPASSQSPVPPAPDGLSPDGSRPPEMIPTPDTPTLGEGTTPLPIPPTDYAPGWADSQGNTNLPWGLFLLLFQWNSSFSPTSFSVRFLPASILFLPLQLKISFLSFFPVSIQSLASSVGLLVLLVIGIVAVCCWRRRKRTRQGYMETEMDIPMEAHPPGNEEVAPPVVVPTG